MSKVDWSKAPEGAEFWFADGESFYKKNENGDFALYWPILSGVEWIKSGWGNDDLSGSRFQQRPSPQENQ